jgi:hypothetical protein
MDHRDVVRAATPTEAQQKQLAAAIEAAEACLEPLIHDHWRRDFVGTPAL